MPDSAFCAHCGTPVPAQTVPPSPRGIDQVPRMPQPGTPYQPPANSALRKAGLWARSAGIIFVFAILVSAIKAGVSQYQYDHRSQPSAEALADLKSQFVSPSTPATRLRILQIGDTWHYTVQGQVQTARGQSVSFKGKEDMLVSRSNQGDPGPLVEYMPANLTLSNGKSTKIDSIIYFRQDAATGDITEMGNNDGPNHMTQQVINPQVTVPGSWSMGGTLSPSLRYATGHIERRIMQITGTESVATGVGTLTTWKSSETSTTLKGGVIQSTVWYAPQLGGIVAQHSVSRGKYGTVLTLDMTLDSTNVPMH